MEVRVLKRIQSAVQSIIDCTSPTLETNGVSVVADGLRSPYVTHRHVEYSESEARYGELFAASGRHKILIQSLHGPNEFPYSTPLFGLMTEWQGGVIPTGVVQPVLDLAEELGLPAIDWREDAKLVKAYVLTPTLATYHLGQPVFWLANEDNTPLDITEYVRDLVAEVGGIRLFRLDASEWGDDHWLLGAVPLWTDEHRVFGVARNDFGGMGDIRRAESARVVAALHRGETVFLTRIDGPATLLAEGGERVKVDACCLAIMPASQKMLARV